MAVELADAGLQMKGQIGPTQEAYYCLTSTSRMWSRPTSHSGDRAVISGQEFISFRAGAVDRLEIDLPEGSGIRRRGALRRQPSTGR